MRAYGIGTLYGGVLDAADTKLNGAAGNLTLADDEIPVRGELHATQTS